MAAPFIVADAAVAVGADLKQYDADLRKAEASGTGTGSRLADALKRDFGGASKVLATGVGALFGAALKGGNDLTTAMANYRAETGATAQETAEVQKATSELFKTNLEGFDTIAGVQAKVRTQLGLTGKAQKEATQLVLDYARATGQDAVAAVGTLDDLTDGYNLTAAQQVDILNKLVASSQQYGGSVEANQAALVALAPALKAANLTYDDGIGLLNLFAQSGIDAADAAGAMTKALAKVKSPEELQRLVADIQNAGTAFEREQLAAELFGTKAGPKMAQALAHGTKGLGEFAIKSEDVTTAVTDASKAIESTPLNWLKLQLKQLLGPLADVAAGIGPIATGLVGLGTLGASLGLDGFVKTVVSKLAEAGKAGGEAFIDASSTAVGTLGTVFGNIIARVVDPTEEAFGNPLRAAATKVGVFFTAVFKTAARIAEALTDVLLRIPGTSRVAAAVTSSATALGKTFGTKFALAAAFGIALVAPEILDAITPKLGRELADKYGEDFAAGLADSTIGELRARRDEVQKAWLNAIALPDGFDPLRPLKTLLGPDNIFGPTSDQKIKQTLDQLNTLIADWEAAHPPAPVEIGVKLGPPLPPRYVADQAAILRQQFLAAGLELSGAFLSAWDKQPLADKLIGMGHDVRLAAAQLALDAAAGLRSGRANIGSALDQLREDMKNRLTPRKEVALRIGELFSRTLARALHDSDPLIKKQAQGTSALIEDQLIETIKAGGKAGQKIQEELERKLHSKDPAVRRQAQRTKALVDAALKAQPPKTPGEKIAQDLNVDLGNAATALGRTAYNLGRTIAQNVVAGVKGSGLVAPSGGGGGGGGSGSSGGGGHHGGQQEFAEGTSYVPADMLAYIHKGEMVIPADDSERIRQGGFGGPLIGELHVDARGHEQPQAVGAAVRRAVGDAMADVLRQQTARLPVGTRA